MAAIDRLDTPAPHKLLALDGGGIRGVMTLRILAEIERLLQHELQKDDTFVLAEYFDYIGGTSTGAIIATCLSLGWRVVSGDVWQPFARRSRAGRLKRRVLASPYDEGSAFVAGEATFLRAEMQKPPPHARG